MRWWILFLLFAAGFLNYMDKGMLGLLAPTIQKDLGFDDNAYADVQNWFQVAYTVATFASGFIVDRFGARISLALFVGWWSVANVLTGFANSVLSLKFYRSLLGLGEAGNWTAAPKTVGEWFSDKERGLAIGVYSIGAPIGMVIAPSLIIGMMTFYGSWKAPFIVTGLLGLVWVLPWLWFYKKSPAPAMAGASGAAMPDIEGTAAKGWTFLHALCRWEVWVLIFGRMLTDPVWGFYQNWYPKYLVNARGFTQTDIKSVWIVFVGAAIGGIIGGWLSGRLVKRGVRAVRARLLVMGMRHAGHVPLAAGLPGFLGQPVHRPRRLDRDGPPRLADEYQHAGRRYRPANLAGESLRPRRRGQLARHDRHEQRRGLHHRRRLL